MSPWTRIPVSAFWQAADPSRELFLAGGSTPFPFALNNRNVAIDRQIGEALDTSAWKRPFNFQPVEIVALAQPKNDAWILRGAIAAAVIFHAAALQIAFLISDACAHRVSLRLLAIP